MILSQSYKCCGDGDKHYYSAYHDESFTAAVLFLFLLSRVYQVVKVELNLFHKDKKKKFWL
jgi:hypothetical protein